MDRPWSEYQRAVFKRVEGREGPTIVEAVAGCLSGETVIGINRGGKSYQGTIRYLVEMLKRRRPKRPDV